jgi:hypothetical protein
MRKALLLTIFAGILVLSIVTAAQPFRQEGSFTTSNGWTVELERQIIVNDFTDDAGQIHYSHKTLTKIWLYDSEGVLRDRETVVDQDNYLGVNESTQDYYWLFRTWTNKFNYIDIVDSGEGEIVVTNLHSKFHDWELQFCKGNEEICALQCEWHPWAC